MKPLLKISEWVKERLLKLLKDGSPGHRVNIMNGNYTHTGIAYEGQRSFLDTTIQSKIRIKIKGHLALEMSSDR